MLLGSERSYIILGFQYDCTTDTDSVSSGYYHLQSTVNRDQSNALFYGYFRPRFGV